MKGRYQSSRRQFVATLGSVALAGMLPRALRASSRRIVVIGAGLGGLVTALELAPMPVLLLSLAPLGRELATAWAQGGF